MHLELCADGVHVRVLAFLSLSIVQAATASKAVSTAHVTDGVLQMEVHASHRGKPSPTAHVVVDASPGGKPTPPSQRALRSARRSNAPAQQEPRTERSLSAEFVATADIPPLQQLDVSSTHCPTPLGSDASHSPRQQKSDVAASSSDDVVDCIREDVSRMVLDAGIPAALQLLQPLSPARASATRKQFLQELQALVERTAEALEVDTAVAKHGDAAVDGAAGASEIERTFHRVLSASAIMPQPHAIKHATELLVQLRGNALSQMEAFKAGSAKPTKPILVLLAGTAGTGKTSLVNLLAQIANEERVEEHMRFDPLLNANKCLLTITATEEAAANPGRKLLKRIYAIARGMPRDEPSVLFLLFDEMQDRGVQFVNPLKDFVDSGCITLPHECEADLRMKTAKPFSVPPLCQIVVVFCSNAGQEVLGSNAHSPFSWSQYNTPDELHTLAEQVRSLVLIKSFSGSDGKIVPAWASRLSQAKVWLFAAPSAEERRLCVRHLVHRRKIIQPNVSLDASVEAFLEHMYTWEQKLEGGVRMVSGLLDARVSQCRGRMTTHLGSPHLAMSVLKRQGDAWADQFIAVVVPASAVALAVREADTSFVTPKANRLPPPTDPACVTEYAASEVNSAQVERDSGADSDDVSPRRAQRHSSGRKSKAVLSLNEVETLLAEAEAMYHAADGQKQRSLPVETLEAMYKSFERRCASSQSSEGQLEDVRKHMHRLQSRVHKLEISVLLSLADIGACLDAFFNGAWNVLSAEPNGPKQFDNYIKEQFGIKATFQSYYRRLAKLTFKQPAFPYIAAVRSDLNRTLIFDSLSLFEKVILCKK